MAKFNISEDWAKSIFSIKDKCINDELQLPKYLSTFLNQINQWAHGSKPENVGQVSELIKEYRLTVEKPNLDSWVEFHNKKEGTDIDIPDGKKGKQKTVKMLGICQGVEDIMKKISEIGNILFGAETKKIKAFTSKNEFKDNVEIWLKNLTYNKTYCGLIAQELILEDIALKKGLKAILGSPFDEQKGIDGYIIDGDKYYPLQIKSSTFKINNKREKFDCPIIEYSLSNDGIEYEFSEEKLSIPKDSATWNELKNRLAARLKVKQG